MGLLKAVNMKNFMELSKEGSQQLDMMIEVNEIEEITNS